MLRCASRLWAGLGLVLAAGEAAADELPPFLRDDVAKTFSRRAQRGFAGEVYFTASGGQPVEKVVVAAPLQGTNELIVVEEGAERVRVVSETMQFRVALYLPRPTLRTVALEGAAVVARAGQPAGAQAAHVELAPGTALALDSPTPDGWRSASYADEELSVSGFVRAEQVGGVYARRALPRSRGDVLLRPNATFFDGAQGKPLARLKASDKNWLDAERDGFGAGTGYWFVRITLGRARVVGWVKVGDVKRNSAERGYSISGQGGIGSGTVGGSGLLVRLPEGTRLLHEGVVVGVIRKQGYFRVKGRRQRGVEPVVLVYSSLGAIPLQSEQPELPEEPDAP